MKTRKQKAFLYELADLLEKYNYRIKVNAEADDPFAAVFSKTEIKNKRGKVVFTFYSTISPSILRERAEE